MKRFTGWGSSHRRVLAATLAVLLLGALVVVIASPGDRSPADVLAGTAAASSTSGAPGTPAIDPGGTSGSGGRATVDPVAPGVAGAGAPAAGPNRPISLTLSAGRAAEPAPPTPVLTGTPLGQDRIAAILRRLPAWAGSTAPAPKFRFPAETLPQPRAGATARIPFPGPGEGTAPPIPDATPAGPLKVLRVQPTGPVAVAPFVSITFNQPMVPIETVGRSADRQVPITLTPKVDGSWLWIGTDTVRFVSSAPDVDRLPMATDYTLTVPSGTVATGGAALAADATFRFSTPPPTVKTFVPRGKSLAADTVFVAVLDQRIDPAAVLRTVTLDAGGTTEPVRRATAAEVKADRAAAAIVKAAPDGRVLAFRAEQPLPLNAPITVTFAAGTPSAEGPRTTKTAKTFSARTHPALGLGNTDCGYGRCGPGSPLVLKFSTPLDTTLFDPTSVTITPEIPGGASVSASGDTISITGATQPDTGYTVTVSSLTDVFASTLSKPAVGTVDIGAATPRLDPFPHQLTTLDPMVEDPSITVNTVNRKEYRERVFAVTPQDWYDYQRWNLATQQQNNDQVPDPPDWPVLSDRVVQVDGPENRLVRTKIDLSAAISGSVAAGTAVVLIEPTGTEKFSGDARWQNRPTVTWVQKTTIGVDAFNDAAGLRTWATDLRTGAPLPGVTIALVGASNSAGAVQGTTDADGMASFVLPPGGARALLATRGEESALLPSDVWDTGWKPTKQRDELLWYVNDDRQTYRPGETVSVKGWVRERSGDTAATLSAPSNSMAKWIASDANGARLGAGTQKLSRTGGFDFTLDLPAGANLGPAQIGFSLTAGGSDNDLYSHAFEIADFRTPAFQVDAHAENAAAAVAGDALGIVADATYYAGGPLGDAPVEWQVRSAPASYAPPGWEAYSFGIWTPWWRSGDAALSSGGFGGAYDYAETCCGPPEPDAGTVDTFAGRTDPAGADHLSAQVADLGSENAGLPVAITAQAGVTDVNRQVIAGTADVLVHPASDYVGLAGTSTFVLSGQELVIKAIATDIDGTVAPGRAIAMTAAKITTSWVNGESVDAESDAQTCAVTSAADPIECTFTPAVAGQYRITATVTDERGRTSRSQLTRWVAGADGSVNSSVQEQDLTVVPDQREYRPGDTATLLVQSPIRAGSGLLTTLHNGIVATKTFAVANGSAVLELPITEADLPGITASIEVVGTASRTTVGGGAAQSQRPAYATGAIALDLSLASRTLAVTATPREKSLAPGGRTTLDVTVTGADGTPVPDTEFEVVVADEAVLAVGGYQLPDVLKTFHPALNNFFTALYSRSLLALTDAEPPVDGAGDGVTVAESSAAASSGSVAMSGAADASAPAAPAAQRAAGTTGESSAPIAVRKSFEPLAVFVPAATTDANGKATVAVTLPDSLTRYRVMVVAVTSDNRFGSAESGITAALPVTVRASAPAFLNFGDTLELPVLVQNQTDVSVESDVVIQASGLDLTESTGVRVTVPARQRVEVRFAAAADQVGTASFRVAVVGGDHADAATGSLPVYTPATTETFAAYGTVPGGKVLRRPVTPPADVIKGFGGLEISTSSTALQQLTDALLYVTDYDYESSDALAAQIIGVGSIGDVLQAFSAPGLPSAAELKKLVAGNLDLLVGLQNEDGGFPYWLRGEKSEPFNSIQATQALLVAQQRGFSVPKQPLARSLAFVKKIKAHLPKQIGPASRDSLLAYALAVRMQAGDRDADAAQAMVADRGAALSLDAVAWLLPVVSDDTVRSGLLERITNAAVDTAGAVTFTTKVTDAADTTLQSNTRTDGLVLDALIAVAPQSDLIGKVVAGLMGAQRGGRWNNIQENALIMVALRHYYDTFESTDPDFAAQIWLGKRFVGQHEYRGRTTEQGTARIPTAVLTPGNSDVTLRADGAGTLFYRIGLDTAPADLALEPLDRGFAVTRSYVGADDPDDVTRDAAGTWHVKAGARVRVKVGMVARSAYSRVALVDPLPAGLQILNPALATTPKDLDPSQRKSEGAGDASIGWYSTWFDHQNLRDERAEAFATWLQGGVYDYSYLALATTPGTFIVPPTKAEQIYAPETFGRAGTDRVVVETP